MNLKRLMNETLVATGGEMSRGLKNQISILNAFVDSSLDEKLDILKQYNIPVYNYTGIRVLEFSLDDIKIVLNENRAKLEAYQMNPQELVRDLRIREMKTTKSSLEKELIGGME